MYANKLSLKDKVRVPLIFLMVLIIGVGLFIYILPKSRIDTIKSEIHTIGKKIASEMNTTQSLESLRQEYNQKQKLLPLMQKVLPAEAQTTEFLAQVLHNARGLNIDFLSIGKPQIVGGQNTVGQYPTGQDPANILQKIRLELSLRSGFPNLINYLDNLRRIHRLFNIVKMQVILDENIAPEVRVDLTIETYSIQERGI